MRSFLERHGPHLSAPLNQFRSAEADKSSQCVHYRVQDLAIGQVEPIHVYQWTDSHPGWKTGKRGAISAVQRAFNWAGKAGLLKSIGSKSPVAAMEKPQQGRREKLVSEGEYQQVQGAVNDQELARETIPLRGNKLYRTVSGKLQLLAFRPAFWSIEDLPGPRLWKKW